MVLGFRRLLKCRVEPSMITDGMITDADSTLRVEASQETFEEMLLLNENVRLTAQ